MPALPVPLQTTVKPIPLAVRVTQASSHLQDPAAGKYAYIVQPGIHAQVVVPHPFKLLRVVATLLAVKIQALAVQLATIALTQLGLMRLPAPQTITPLLIRAHV